MLAAIWSNQWFADTVTGLIVAGVLGLPPLYIRWQRKQNREQTKEILAEMLKEVRPNGGDTLSSGDTVQRIENKMDALIVTVATQKGHTDASEREVLRRLNKLETREELTLRLDNGTE